MPPIDFKAVLCESSSRLRDYTASVVGSDPGQFEELIRMAYEEKQPLAMRAAWVADRCCEIHPDLVRPYLVDMVRRLPGMENMSVKRIFMHILIRHSWVDDEEAMGRLLDALLRWLTDDTQSIAVKAYSMEILRNLSVIFPDLRTEIAAVLEEAVPTWDSAALRYNGKKMMKALRMQKSGMDSDI